MVGKNARDDFNFTRSSAKDVLNFRILKVLYQNNSHYRPLHVYEHNDLPTWLKAKIVKYNNIQFHIKAITRKLTVR